MSPTPLSLVAEAIRDAGDTFVIHMVYTDGSGTRKRRYVSPFAFTDPNNVAFDAMCLTSGELRRFILSRCEEVAKAPAHEVLIPMPMETL